MERIDWAKAPEGAEFYAESRFCKVAGIRVIFYKDGYGWTKSPLTVEQCLEAKDYEVRPNEWPEEDRIDKIGINGATGEHYETVTIDDVVYRHNENGMYALYLKTKNGTWAESAKVTNEDLKKWKETNKY